MGLRSPTLPTDQVVVQVSGERDRDEQGHQEHDIPGARSNRCLGDAGIPFGVRAEVRAEVRPPKDRRRESPGSPCRTECKVVRRR